MAGQRIAINCGGGVPGLNGRTVGAATAAQEVGWTVVCVREGKHVSPVQGTGSSAGRLTTGK